MRVAMEMIQAVANKILKCYMSGSCQGWTCTEKDVFWLLNPLFSLSIHRRRNKESTPSHTVSLISLIFQFYSVNLSYSFSAPCSYCSLLTLHLYID
ncbi:hypothetical protein SRHO_G00036880 [Serrasalmus rhombeus]